MKVEANGSWRTKCFSTNWLKKKKKKKSPWLTQYVSQKFPFVTVLAFHPNDGDILYLVIEMKVALCNLRCKTIKVFCDIPHGYEDKCTIINFVLPCWPTPIP